MSENDQYDAIVIGAGKAGTPLSIDLAENGLKTAIIDGRFIGVAPIEERAISKSYAVCSKNAAIIRRAESFGFTGSHGPLSADNEKLKIRAGDLSAATQNASALKLFKTDGLHPLEGFASFIDRNTVLVVSGNGESSRINASKIFISTGTRNNMPDIPGLSESGYLSAESLWKLEQIPSRLTILGGGYIGIEIAQEFRRFGAEVTVIQRNQRILPHEDSDFSDAVHKLLSSEGIRIITSATTERVYRRSLHDLEKPDPVCLEIKTDDGVETIVGSHLFLAAGRMPNTGTLNLGDAGIHFDSRGYINVNDRLETSAEGIWAMGDVTGSPAFANLSYDDYRIIARNLFDHAKASRQGRIISTNLYIDPPLAGVGLKESELDGLEGYRIDKIPVETLQYAKDAGTTAGFVKAISDESSGRLLGFGMYGPSAGELAGAAHLAIMGGLTRNDLRDGLFSLPGAMEVFNELFKI